MKTLRYRIILCLLFTSAAVAAQKLHETEWERGMMTKKTKVGVWEYFGRTPAQQQVLVQRYDHDKQRLLYYRPAADAFYLAETAPGVWKTRLLDQPPLFIGGDAALAAYTTQLNYPMQAQAQNVQGRLVVSFVIDTLGQISGYKLLNRLGSGCDEEAMRIAHSIPGKWIPGRLGSHPVAVQYVLPLTFRLAE